MICRLLQRRRKGVWGEQLLKQRKDRKWNVNQIAHTEEDLEVAESVVEASALESVSETESINNEEAGY